MENCLDADKMNKLKALLYNMEAEFEKLSVD
jgi:hypothetical protein